MTYIWSGYHEGYKQFRSDYEKKYGFQPYVSPVVQYCL